MGRARRYGAMVFLLTAVPAIVLFAAGGAETLVEVLIIAGAIAAIVWVMRLSRHK
jgi:hypothetical protein